MWRVGGGLVGLTVTSSLWTSAKDLCTVKLINSTMFRLVPHRLPPASADINSLQTKIRQSLPRSSLIDSSVWSAGLADIEYFTSDQKWLLPKEQYVVNWNALELPLNQAELDTAASKFGVSILSGMKGLGRHRILPYLRRCDDSPRATLGSRPVRVAVCSDRDVRPAQHAANSDLLCRGFLLDLKSGFPTEV
ncbi:hypothetical protein PHLGIDRAFT_510709 [Phlebiopsis gigantea 11061_1 CR5-6]|uniref:Uncharacterized protein n=1 Tax=Phlebiopsis gigantea (strain 11061_1 CR5-6) TaxID=745531 RepID=A0A0C3RY88_PHLG1|nr:hypothetical protein PHLGIDRAFT_510709 [Phlebiopsis gigantea 11061_1 CR5-6]